MSDKWLKTWALSTKATPHDWLQLIPVLIENKPQLLWKCYWREEETILEQQGKAKGFQNSQDQILGESHYSDPQEQGHYDEFILSLCSTAALNAWDRIQGPGKSIESYIRVKPCQKEPFSDFLQRLTKAVQVGMSDPKTRHVLIESLTFENVN